MARRTANKWLVRFGVVLAALGTIGSVVVIFLASAPPAEGNFAWLWITMPAALAGVGVVFAATLARGRKANVAAALWILCLCLVPYIWGVIRETRGSRLTVGTFGTVILLVLGVPGVAMLLWSLLAGKDDRRA